MNLGERVPQLSCWEKVRDDSKQRHHYSGVDICAKLVVPYEGIPFFFGKGVRRGAGNPSLTLHTHQTPLT